MIKLSNTSFLPPHAIYDEMESPIGILTIVVSAQELHAILWETERNNPNYKQMLTGYLRDGKDKNIVKIKQQLTEYFHGKRKEFDLPLKLNGTAFQLQVWKQLAKIPYAQTISYGEQAMRIGDKNKARAVGMANGRNPIPIIIPCHRVIGSNGKLVGFGGGLDNKKFLLQLEKQHLK